LNSSASTVLVDSLALLDLMMAPHVENRFQITKFQIKSKSNHTFSNPWSSNQIIICDSIM